MEGVGLTATAEERSGMPEVIPPRMPPWLLVRVLYGGFISAAVITAHIKAVIVV